MGSTKEFDESDLNHSYSDNLSVRKKLSDKL